MASLVSISVAQNTFFLVFWAFILTWLHPDLFLATLSAVVVEADPGLEAFNVPTLFLVQAPGRRRRAIRSTKPSGTQFCKSSDRPRRPSLPVENEMLSGWFARTRPRYPRYALNVQDAHPQREDTVQQFQEPSRKACRRPPYEKYTLNPATKAL